MTLILGVRDRFSPYQLSPSVLRGWFGAADHGTGLMTDDGGGLISSWSDRVSGNVLTAITTARPTWGATAFNGAYPGVAFDGVANNLTCPVVVNWPSSSAPGCVVAVFSITTGSAVNGRFATYGTTAASREIFNGTSGVVRVTDGVVGINAPGGALFATPQVIVAEYNATSMNAWRNGEPFVSNPATIALSTTPTRIRFGAAAGTSASAFGACVLADYGVTTPLTTAMRQQFEGWAAWQYGFQANLIAGHPYRNTRP